MIIIIYPVVFLLILFVVVAGISVHVGLKLVHPKRRVIVEYPELYGLCYEEVTLHSEFDNIALSSWWIPSQKDGKILESEKTIIFSHGYGDSRDQNVIQVLKLAKRLTGEGYNVMMYDFRNSGMSEGKITSVGVFEKHDLLSVVKYVREYRKSAEIMLMGWSMGAAVSIVVAAELPEIIAVVADSSFADLADYLEDNLNVWSHLPNFPFTPVIMKAISLLIGTDPRRMSPCKVVHKLGSCKLLLVHSKGDKYIPYENSLKIYDCVKGNPNVEIWITEEPNHIETYLFHKEEYENRVVEFLKDLVK